MQFADGEATTDEHGFDQLWPEQNDQQPRVRRRVVLGLAVAPWIIVVGMIAGPFGRSPASLDDAGLSPSHLDHGAHHESPHAHDASAIPPGFGSDSLTALSTDLDGHRPITDRLAAAGAAATIAARAWLTGVEPHLTTGGMAPGNERWYVEHLAVEVVEPFNAELAVATVLAIVLGGSDQLDVHLRRIAVPIWLSPSIEPASAPWWLPEPDWNITPLDTHHVEDPQLYEHARRALQRQGYLDVQVISLERSARWPWLVRADARTPAGERLSTPVLLYEDAEGFSVAAHRLTDGLGATAGATHWGSRDLTHPEVER